MRVAYVTSYDANDVSNWSGTGFYMAESLRSQSMQVDLIGPVRNKYSPLSILFKGKQYLYRYLANKNYLHDREPVLLRSYSNKAIRKLKKSSADIVFSPSTIPVAYLESEAPIVFWTDATFAGLIDFYPEFSNLCQETIRNGNAAEKLALDRCKLAIYSSEWAARTAIENYDIDESKVRVVPFGANIECRRNFADIKQILESRSSDKCKLLFIGVDWWRKGGKIAFEVAKELNQAGIQTELTVVGCTPNINKPLPSFVRSLGFISKSSIEGRERLDRLIAESHFLILPSVAECSAIVFSEANSFGVPCLTTKVGGIPTIVRDGINGMTFSSGAKTQEYCQYVSSLFENYSEYQKLAMSAFEEYQSRLNWVAAGRTVKQLLIDVVQR